ncbi:outer membrane lipoprotein carrier protein LolA [Shewanella waksmanii]|uniref:outer membrane lipoprotein carrier protein LolA n=1 Tax=Shewanella waksmanii TaxID=213783 RepID=UPI003734FB42
MFARHLHKLFRLLLLPLWCISIQSFADNAEYQALFTQQADEKALQQLAQQLNQGPQAIGEFSQSRQLAVLNKALISHGKFTFDSQHGLAWEQLKPFYSALVLSGQQITQIDALGQQQTMQAQGSAAAIANLMPQLLQAMLSGNVSQLQQQFKIGFIQNGDHWQLGLIADTPELAKLLPNIVIKGEQQVRQLLLLSDNGDRSTIDFTQLDYRQLSPSELDIFNGVDADANEINQP